MFWVYLKILSVPKSLRTLKANFEEADGLGISCWNQNVAKYRQEWSLIWRISFTTFSKNYIIPKRLQILVSYAMFFGSTGFPFFNQSECTARQCCIAIGRTFRKLVLKNLHCLGFSKSRTATGMDVTLPKFNFENLKPVEISKNSFGIIWTSLKVM